MATVLAAPRQAPSAAGPGLAPVGFLGVAVASIGGPLALAGLFVPSVLGTTGRSAALTVALASVLFLPPLAVWVRYSERIASAGGLYAFVEAAAGPRVARVQGVVWTVSYLLYVVYTVAYVVYDVLPAVVPAVAAYRSVLEVVLPLVVTAVVLAPLRFSAAVIAALAAGQVAVVGLVTAGGFANVGAASTAWALPAGGLPTLGHGAATASLLYVCASLPLFLGGEVRGGARTVRRGLVTAYTVVAVGLLAAVIPLATAGRAITGAEVPGVALTRRFAGGGAATAVGIGIAVSVLALMAVEFLALSRLWHAMSGRPVRTTARWVAVAFLAGNLVSLVDPQRFYDDLLRPSLVALWVSQLLVVAVYPMLRRRRGAGLAGDVGLAVLSCGLFGFGLYTSLSAATGT
jgi:amino acid transporter